MIAWQQWHAVLEVCKVCVKLGFLSRSQDSQAMAERITDEVNAILSQEAGSPTLTKQAVLDLIDQGASEGGPQASFSISL